MCAIRRASASSPRFSAHELPPQCLNLGDSDSRALGDATRSDRTVVPPDEAQPASYALLEDQGQAFTGVAPHPCWKRTVLHLDPSHRHRVRTRRSGVRAVKVEIICHRGSLSFA